MDTQFGLPAATRIHRTFFDNPIRGGHRQRINSEQILSVPERDRRLRPQPLDPTGDVIQDDPIKECRGDILTESHELESAPLVLDLQFIYGVFNAASMPQTVRFGLNEYFLGAIMFPTAAILREL
uniref:Uncharacterized protein n=1 Tax=Spongospora subterranea TaxID=70186 RepID=A0A0H5QXV8_9EUKA|eukprot:CRZ06798.1 hypothetical protein [Spongospora subterranea]